MRRKLLCAIFLIHLSPLILLILLNLSGFCFTKMRWLSKREKIESVFNYLNSREKLAVDRFEDGVFKRNFYEHIKYDNFEEYVEKYPNCCAVNPGGGYDLPPPSIIEQMFGFNSGDVIVIKFKVRYLDESKMTKTEEVVHESFIQNCGKTCKCDRLRLISISLINIASAKTNKLNLFSGKLHLCIYALKQAI